jgi:hypothetical protein
MSASWETDVLNDDLLKDRLAVRSQLRRAIETYSVLTPTLTSRIAPSPAWVALLSLATSPDYASGIRKFACFCTVIGAEPYQVGDARLLLGFHDALVAEGMVKDPRKAIHLVTSYWNMHTRRVPSWPQIRLSSPFPSQAYSLPLMDFPESFQRDIAKWRHNQLEVDIFDELGLQEPSARSRSNIKWPSSAVLRLSL